MSDCIEISLLARLLKTGQIKAGIKNDYLIRRFDAARWIYRGTRKQEWLASPHAISSMEQRLYNLLPSWQQDFNFLIQIGRTPFDSSDLQSLPMLRRKISVLGKMINRRNWQASVGLGPKHKAKIPPDGVLTKDWILRFRPNKGLVAHYKKGEINLSENAELLTECAIPERAWLGFDKFAGDLPKTIVTCENLGAYIDFPATDSNLIVFSPGKDTEAVIFLLKTMPSVPWIHFGDLDQEGVDIANQIAKETQREVRFFIPTFAADYLDAARPIETAWGDVPDLLIFFNLKEKNKRIFQEIFMLDDRLGGEPL